MSTVTRTTDRLVVLSDVSWGTFVALSKEASGGRLAYDRGQLEIMSPSFEHESVKGLIGRLFEIFCLELDVDVASAGSTTLKRADLARGIESDECYYVSEAARVRGKDEIDLPFDPPPDLAIEVDISRSSVNKLAICAAIGIREVWRYDGHVVEIHVLQNDSSYVAAPASVVLPQFPISELNRVLQHHGEQSETRITRDFQRWIRENLVP